MSNLDPDVKICSRCNGVGSVQIASDTWKRCSCSFARVFKTRVGVEIATAPFITDSPLLSPGVDGAPPSVDRTKSNLFLKGRWSVLLPHIKHTLVFKNFEYDLSYLCPIVTDERLRDVYLSKEAYSSKSKKNRDDVPTFNSLSDIIGPDNHLVIIRLGFLGYKNVAMPGILKEALLLRQAASRPTWLVDMHDDPYVPGHKAYSEETNDYIQDRFETIEFKRTDSTPEGVEEEKDPGMVIDEDPDPAPKERTRTARAEYSPKQSNEDSGLDMVTGTSKGKRPKARRNGGDGP